MDPVTTSCITNYSREAILVHSALFLAGACFGACVGVLVTCLCVVAKRADDAFGKLKAHSS